MWRAGCQWSWRASSGSETTAHGALSLDGLPFSGSQRAEEKGASGAGVCQEGLPQGTHQRGMKPALRMWPCGADHGNELRVWPSGADHGSISSKPVAPPKGNGNPASCVWPSGADHNGECAHGPDWNRADCGHPITVNGHGEGIHAGNGRTHSERSSCGHPKTYGERSSQIGLKRMRSPREAMDHGNRKRAGTTRGSSTRGNGGRGADHPLNGTCVFDHTAGDWGSPAPANMITCCDGTAMISTQALRCPDKDKVILDSGASVHCCGTEPS